MYFILIYRYAIFTWGILWIYWDIYVENTLHINMLRILHNDFWQWTNPCSSTVEQWFGPQVAGSTPALGALWPHYGIWCLLIVSFFKLFYGANEVWFDTEKLFCMLYFCSVDYHGISIIWHLCGTTMKNNTNHAFAAGISWYTVLL